MSDWINVLDDLKPKEGQHVEFIVQNQIGEKMTQRIIQGKYQAVFGSGKLSFTYPCSINYVGYEVPENVTHWRAKMSDNMPDPFLSLDMIPEN